MKLIANNPPVSPSQTLIQKSAKAASAVALAASLLIPGSGCSTVEQKPNDRSQELMELADKIFPEMNKAKIKGESFSEILEASAHQFNKASVAIEKMNPNKKPNLEKLWRLGDRILSAYDGAQAALGQAKTDAEKYLATSLAGRIALWANDYPTAGTESGPKAHLVLKLPIHNHISMLETTEVPIKNIEAPKDPYQFVLDPQYSVAPKSPKSAAENKKIDAYQKAVLRAIAKKVELVSNAIKSDNSGVRYSIATPDLSQAYAEAFNALIDAYRTIGEDITPEQVAEINLASQLLKFEMENGPKKLRHMHANGPNGNFAVTHDGDFRSYAYKETDFKPEELFHWAEHSFKQFKKDDAN